MSSLLFIFLTIFCLFIQRLSGIRLNKTTNQIYLLLAIIYSLCVPSYIEPEL